MTALKSLRIEPADVFAGMPIVEPNWVWDQQMATGCLTLLVGKPKTGKSLFVRNLLRAMSKQEALLGYQCKSGPMLYLALEEHPWFLQQELIGMDLNNQSLHVHVGPVGGSIDQVFGELQDFCEMYRPKLIVIDPLAKFLRCGDVNDYLPVYKEMSALGKFARDYEVHILALHHSNKTNSQNSEQVLGSTGFFGSSDGAFFISRDADDRCTLWSNLRYGQSLERAIFKYDAEKRLVSLGSQQEEREIISNRRILDALHLTGSSSLDEIQEYTGLKREKLISALKDLCENGQVLSLGRGVRGAPMKYSVPDSVNTRGELNSEARHGN